jgi:tetratricopeptide (TPR) repeat protein
LNDPAKALDSYERALSLYLNQADIRDAIRMLVDAKLQTADALFTRKEFQDSARMARAILQSYPDNYLASDAKAKAQWLVDRVDRAGRIQAADADQMFVSKETEDAPQASSDFAPSNPVTGARVSPDGTTKALVRKQNGVPYLYLGKAADVKGSYHLVDMSTGACRPEWSPSGDALVYVRVLGPTQKLERLDPKTGKTIDLFFAKNGSLGRYPAFDPSGSKVAFVYVQCLWVINADGTNKTKLRTEKPVDPGTVLAWSSDGTLVRYRTAVEKGTGQDKLLVLDAGTQNP